MRLNTLLASAFVVIAPACHGDQLGRSDVLAVWFPPGREASVETLSEVEEIFGMEVLVAESAYGTTALYVYPEGLGDQHGYAADGIPCSGSAWTLDHFRVMAHELGHATGIGHVSDPNNLMYPDSSGIELSDDQIDVVRQSNWVHEECRKEDR